MSSTKILGATTAASLLLQGDKTPHTLPQPKNLATDVKSTITCVADNGEIDFVHAARLNRFRTTGSDGNEFGSKLRTR
jgi:hypothetical protein